MYIMTTEVRREPGASLDSHKDEILQWTQEKNEEGLEKDEDGKERPSFQRFWLLKEAVEKEGSHGDMWLTEGLHEKRDGSMSEPERNDATKSKK